MFLIARLLSLVKIPQLPSIKLVLASLLHLFIWIGLLVNMISRGGNWNSTWATILMVSLVMLTGPFWLFKKLLNAKPLSNKMRLIGSACFFSILATILLLVDNDRSYLLNFLGYSHSVEFYLAGSILLPIAILPDLLNRLWFGQKWSEKMVFISGFFLTASCLIFLSIFTISSWDGRLWTAMILTILGIIASILGYKIFSQAKVERLLNITYTVIQLSLFVGLTYAFFSWKFYDFITYMSSQPIYYLMFGPWIAYVFFSLWSVYFLWRKQTK